MVRNYANNRPYGGCRELAISPDSFKAKVEKWIEEIKISALCLHALYTKDKKRVCQR